MVTGVLVAFFAGVANINEVVELTNIGTLFAFVLVCIGVTVLRYKEPDAAAPFKVPFGAWLVPMLGVVTCVFLMVYLPPASWWRFVGWLTLGMSIYFAYGYHHSVVGLVDERPGRHGLALKVASAGALLVTVGLFAIPHDAGPGRLLAIARDAAAEGHERALWGLAAIAVGVLVTLASLASVRERRTA